MVSRSLRVIGTAGGYMLDGAISAAYSDSMSFCSVDLRHSCLDLIGFPSATMIQGLPIGVPYAFQMKSETTHSI